MAAGGGYKLRVLDAKLYALRINLSSQMLGMYDRLSASRGLSYPATNIITSTKTISQGDENFEWVPFSAQLLQRIYIWQIDQAAYNGALSRNPLNFKLLILSKLQVYRNGLCLPTSQGLTDMKQDGYLKTYLSSLAAINSPETIPLTIYQYKFGSFITVVNLTNDASSGCSYDNPTQTGTLRIAADYAVSLPNPVTIFCMGEMNGTFTIDGDRNIGRA